MPTGDWPFTHGTSNLNPAWYIGTPAGTTHTSTDVVVDNLDQAVPTPPAPCLCDGIFPCASYHCSHQPKSAQSKRGVSVDNSPDAVTWQLAPEKSTPQPLAQTFDCFCQQYRPAHYPPLDRHSQEKCWSSADYEQLPNGDLHKISTVTTPPPIRLASLHYFDKYWTLHTELDKLTPHQLEALGALVRDEQAKRK